MPVERRGLICPVDSKTSVGDPSCTEAWSGLQPSGLCNGKMSTIAVLPARCSGRGSIATHSGITHRARPLRRIPPLHNALLVLPILSTITKYCSVLLIRYFTTCAVRPMMLAIERTGQLTTVHEEQGVGCGRRRRQWRSHAHRPGTPPGRRGTDRAAGRSCRPCASRPGKLRARASRSRNRTSPVGNAARRPAAGRGPDRVPCAMRIGARRAPDPKGGRVPAGAGRNAAEPAQPFGAFCSSPRGHPEAGDRQRRNQTHPDQQ